MRINRYLVATSCVQVWLHLDRLFIMNCSSEIGELSPVLFDASYAHASSKLPKLYYQVYWFCKSCCTRIGFTAMRWQFSTVHAFFFGVVVFYL